VINRSVDVRNKDETRARILAAAEALNYRPHAGARSLRTENIAALGMLVPDLANPAHTRIVRGAFARASERDLTVLLAEDHGERHREQLLTELVRSGRIEGLLVASANEATSLAEYLDSSGVPHVFVNRAVEGSGRNIVLDSGSASIAAVEHLAALGHRTIGHIAGPAVLESGRRRARAFQQAVSRLGLEGGLVVHSDFTEAGGAAGAAALLERVDPPTALYASSLRQGVGVLHSAWHAGLQVPHDLSVISYDDLPLAKFTIPPLTAIEAPLERLGAASVDALVDVVDGKEIGDVVLPADPSVVVRSSTGPPPGFRRDRLSER
jgi:LacI family transcriptional regulator